MSFANNLREIWVSRTNKSPKRKENEMQDQELYEHGEEDFMWCLNVDDENGDEIFSSGFIFDTEEDAFQEGSVSWGENRVCVISDFEQNKINNESDFELWEEGK